ncbi:MAG: hypothetical protein V7707_08085 [Motiliproteus sp.]
MNLSHQTDEQLQANRQRVWLSESYGASIAGQRMLGEYDKELERRETLKQQSAIEHCGGDCGDCNGCQPVNLCDRCRRKDHDCPIGGHGALACVEFRGMIAR